MHRYFAPVFFRCIWTRNELNPNFTSRAWAVEQWIAPRKTWPVVILTICSNITGYLYLIGYPFGNSLRNFISKFQLLIYFELTKKEEESLIVPQFRVTTKIILKNPLKLSKNLIWLRIFQCYYIKVRAVKQNWYTINLKRFSNM